MKGCDFAFGVVPGKERALARALKADGFGFVVRYLSYTAAKNLSAAEVTAYRAEGIHIVTVWESTGTDALQGASAGHSDALAAKAQLEQLGAPAHAPVYFAVDFDIQPAQMPALDAYLNSTAFVLTEELNGVYGGLRAVTADHVRYKWQAYAWSGGKWDLSDAIRQTLNSAGMIQGIYWDADIAEEADFGQWTWPATHAKPPKPKKKVIKKTVTKGKTVVKKEPVLTAGTLAAALSALLAYLQHTKTVTLTPAELQSAAGILVALAGVIATTFTKPKPVGAATTALATGATVVASTLTHLGPTGTLAQVPLGALAVALLARGHLTPTAPPAAPPEAR